MMVVGLFVVVALSAVVAVAQLTGGTGGGGGGNVVATDDAKRVSDITFYMEEMLWGIQAPCGCGALDPAIIARCIASMAERCAREQAKDVDWLVAHGGFAGFPQTDLTRLQVARVFASVDFGPCDVFAQRGQNGTLHSAWRRTYSCGGSIYSGVEAVETVFDPATNLVRWNWVANEPLWAGLGACVAALL